jgi:hypothetical protein
MPNKIKPDKWMQEAAKEWMDSVFQVMEIDRFANQVERLAVIIAAHAPAAVPAPTCPTCGSADRRKSKYGGPATGTPAPQEKEK